MAVSDSVRLALPLVLWDALLPLPIDFKEICERKLLMMLSGDQPWKSGRSTGRQAATIAIPISSIPQNMRMLTIPEQVNRYSAALAGMKHTNIVVGRHTSYFRLGKYYVTTTLATLFDRKGWVNSRAGPRITPKSAMRVIPQAMALYSCQSHKPNLQARYTDIVPTSKIPRMATFRRNGICSARTWLH